MKSIAVSYSKAAQLGLDEQGHFQQLLHPEIERLAAARATGYTSVYASLALPEDTAMLAQILQLVEEKERLNPAMLIVIGIGGSSLGARAVHEALHGMYYNELTSGPKIYFAETVDTDAVYDILSLAEAVLEQGQQILVNVISKSGTTTETIANYELFIQLLQHYYDESWHQYVVTTTDKDSALWHLATKHSISCLPIPARVGGRYSVFCAVGLFPLAFIGVDVRSLVDGARAMVAASTNLSLSRNSAALSAATIVHQYKRGFTIHDMFVFSVELEGVGRWYRQLVGESLGKTASTGERVGITPTVSVGSTDLHSVGQLYLGGPRDKLTTFVTLDHGAPECVIPSYPEFEDLVVNIQGKSLSYIMHAIERGIRTAYEQQEIPFIACALPEKTPYYVAQLLQWKMIEIMYVGYLLKVNPFDQPHVEQYKVETRKILANE